MSLTIHQQKALRMLTDAGERGGLTQHVETDNGPVKAGTYIHSVDKTDDAVVWLPPEEFEWLRQSGAITARKVRAKDRKSGRTAEYYTVRIADSN